MWDYQAAKKAEQFKQHTDPKLEILPGPSGVSKLAVHSEANLVLHAIPGFAGVAPLFASLEGGKRVAIAGKEALVSGGDLIAPFIKEKDGLLPVDSEHSAIFQCLLGERPEDIEYITLTASGGAFRDLSINQLKLVTPDKALRHPTWRMGPKVTVDSATLFNKTLEVMEAHYLFGLPYDKIKVVIHRQSIVHSKVTFKDGSTKAQLAKPDMRLAIAYAFNYPIRRKVIDDDTEPFLGTLTFEKPDLERFPCLTLGYEAGQIGGTAPCVLSASDEIVVKAFLSGKVKFNQIYKILKNVLNNYRPRSASSIKDLEQDVKWAKAETLKVIDWVVRR